MTTLALPDSIDNVDAGRWESFQPYFAELQQRELAPDTVEQWLADWSHLTRLLEECAAWIYIKKSQDTADKQSEQAFLDLVNNVVPQATAADQVLKERLLSLDISDEEMALVLRNMRNEADLFREENIPLITHLRMLSNQYDKVTGGLTAEWEGEEKNLNQMEVLLQEKERAVRERAWRQIMAMWLRERQTLNQVYREMLELREKVAANADLPDHRAYAFRRRGRFDYTPEDCFVFHQAIESAVVPAARRILEKRRRRLGVDTLRPWDLAVEPGDLPPLRPYQGQQALIKKAQLIFDKIDPELGGQFAILAEENLLDLDTRSGKSLGGYCSALPLRGRPFIFMNGTGVHDNVQTLFHEAGHAFHAFVKLQLPLIWQAKTPMEFNEVASMSLELLAAPYLPREQGGFYSPAEAARARIEHLEGIILFLPYMAVVDAFQHWVYTHPEQALDSAACDAAWDSLWLRFMPVTDWTGLETERQTGWHRKLHIFQSPFYYIEYGMAQVGALQIWRNSLEDPVGTLRAYRQALALGGTRALPELFEAAGAQFRFDTPLLEELVALVEETVADLEHSLEAQGETL